MNYYIITVSTDLNVLGNHPQVVQDDSKMSSSNSEIITFRRFPTIDPFYSVKINRGAKLTDVIWNIGGMDGLCVSNKVKKIFDGKKLPTHRYFKVNVDFMGDDFPYNSIHMVFSILDYMSFEKSSFELYSIASGKEPLEIVNFSSIDELKEFNSSLSFDVNLRVHELVLNDNFPKYDLFSLSAAAAAIDLVSENLKNALEEVDCTGFSFTPYNKLIFN